MSRSVCLLATVFLLGSEAAARPEDKAPVPRHKLPDGVYVVQREGLKEQDVRPLKDGEALVVQRHRYLKKGENEAPRFLAVHSAPDVNLDLAGEPKAIKQGTEVVGILMKLQPKAATALERTTRDRLGGQVAIILGGEVVTIHKIRAAIKGGEVQITSCAAGAAGYLLQQLQTHQKK